MNGSLGERRHGGPGRHAGRQRHDRRQLVANAGTLAPGNSIGTLERSTATSCRPPAAPTRSRPMPRARPTASMSAARRRSRAARCRCWPSPATTPTARPTRSCAPPAASSGTYSGVTSNFAFLTPTLSLRRQRRVPHPGAAAQNAFTPSFLALTPNQRAVGVALNQSFANASGDFATVIGALAGLNTVQGPLALEYDQRRALCRLRHHEHQQQHDVHERAGPADGQRARRGERPASARRWPRPARSRAAMASAR